MSGQTWRGVEAELDELDRRNPKVRAARAARKRLDDPLSQDARRERHLAARRAVGKRPLPDEEREHE